MSNLRASSRLLLSWHGGDEIVFSDEKLFVLQAPHHVQNDRLWAVSYKDIPNNKKHVPRYQSSSSVMVWGAVCKRGTLPLIFIDFIPKEEWPPSSPDLNPLDFSIWGYMLQKLKNYRYGNLDEFKTIITKVWDEIPIDVVRAACNSFETRLRRVVRAEGDTIE